MAQQKIFVLGTVQPGLNANFRKAGFCGTMKTPMETKAVLDMLEKERWAIPFDHLFYRDGVDEANPPDDLKMQGDDVIGEFFGGVLTEKGDTVMVAELDTDHRYVKHIMTELDAYQQRVAKQIADGVKREDLEKPPFGFSPQIDDVKFDVNNGVVSKDFKNISIVSDPEYGPEGAYFHSISYDRDKIMRHLASEFLSKDAYVSSSFGDQLWSLRADSRPVASYTPKILIPIEDEDPIEEVGVDDPMDTDESVVGESADTAIPEPSAERAEDGHTDSAGALSVFSSHDKSDQPTLAPVDPITPPAEPANPMPPAQSGHTQSLSSPSRSETPMSLSQNSSSSAGGVPDTPPQESTAAGVDPAAANQQQPKEPLPGSADVDMLDSLPPQENREQQRTRAAESSEDFFKRAQQRQREMNSLETEATRVITDADRILKEMAGGQPLTDFTDVGSLLQKFHVISDQIDKLNLGRRETPMAYNIATAKTNDVLKRWNEAMGSAAKEHDMQNDLPDNMDAMMTNPEILQSNQQILKVFSKSLRVASSASKSQRVNQRTLEEEAEKLRLSKKRARQDDASNESASNNREQPEKRSKLVESSKMIEVPKGRVIGTLPSYIMDLEVRSSRSAQFSGQFPLRFHEGAMITPEQDAVRQRWKRLASEAVASQ